MRRSLVVLVVSLFTLSTSLMGCGNSLSKSAFDRAYFRNSPSNALGGSPINSDVWAGVDTMGVVSGGPFDQTQIWYIDKKNNLLVMSVPVPGNILGGVSTSYDVPEIPGATVSISQNSSGQWMLNFNMPLQYLVKGFQFIDEEKLPNGSPLPGVPGGELPRIAGHIKNSKLDLYVYGNVKYFALFVPTPGFNPFVNLTFPIMDQQKKKILGYISTVAQKGAFDGGLFMSLAFPPELARALDDLFG